MASTVLYLLLLSPVFLFTIWYMTSTLSPPPILPALTEKRIILLIAHPDDESMFFSPAVQALTRPELGNHVKILCMSTGDSEGLGATRKQELETAAVTLGLRKKEDVFTMDDKRFRDGMKEEWDEKEIARVLAQAFAPQLIPNSNASHARTASGIDLDVKHKRTSSSAHSRNGRPVSSNSASASPAASADLRGLTPLTSDGPQASIDVLLTFDAQGISGHPNHKALYYGSKIFLEQVMKGYSGYKCPVALYTLTTTNIVRKYMFILDVLPTYLTSVGSKLFASSKNTGQAGKGNDRAVFISDISSYATARKAMVKGHKSQMIWFRWGWISLGRYMVINDLRREYARGS